VHLTQLDLFVSKDRIARKALADIKAVDAQLVSRLTRRAI
jgi:hypothetical protein